MKAFYSLIKESRIYYLNSISSYVYAFAFTVLGARYLGKESWGTLLFYTSLSMLIGVLIEYGAGIYGVRVISLCKNDPEKRTKVWNAIHSIKPTLIFLTALGLVLFYLFFKKDDALFLWSAIAFLTGLANGLNSSWFLQSTKGYDRYVVFEFFIKLLGSSLFILSYYYFPNALLIYSLALSISLFCCFTSFQLSRDQLVKEMHHKANVYEQLKVSFPEFTLRISIAIFVQLNAITLGLLGNVELVATFGGGEKIVRALFSIIVPLSQYFFVQLCSHEFGKNRPLEIWSERILFGSSLLIAIGAYFSSEWLVRLLLGNKMIDSIEILKMMVWLMPASALNYIWGLNYWVRIGKSFVFSITTVFSSLLCLFLAYIFVHRWGVTGMAFSVIAAEWFCACLLGVLKLLYQKRYASQ